MTAMKGSGVRKQRGIRFSDDEWDRLRAASGSRSVPDWIMAQVPTKIVGADGEVPGQEDMFGAPDDAEPAPEAASRAAHPTALPDPEDAPVPHGHIHRPDRSVAPEERYMQGQRQVRWPCDVPGCGEMLEWRRG